MIIYLKHQIMRRFYVGITALLLVCLGLFAQVSYAADQLLLERGSFEDVTNQLSYEQIKNQSFEPFENILAKGFSHSTYWLKLKVKGNTGDPLVLKITPVFTDEIELFDEASKGGRRVTGELHAWSKSDYRKVDLNFRLEPTAHDRYIFVRVKSNQNYIVYPQIFLEEDFEHREALVELFSISYTIFILTIFLWIVFTWLMSGREWVIGCFAIVELFATLHAFFLLGLARVYFDGWISNNILNAMTNYVGVSYVAVTIYAHYFLIAEHGLRPAYKALFILIGCAPLLCLLSIALGYDLLGLKSNLIVALLFPILFIASIVRGVKYDSDDDFSEAPALPRRFLKAYYTLLLAILSVILLPYLGVLGAVGFSIYAVFIHALLSGLLIFGLMRYRLMVMQKRQMQVALYDRTLAAQEKIRREEQGKLIGMLTHEVKNSLSVINFSIDSIFKKIRKEEDELALSVSQFQGAIDDIGSVIDKCVDVDRVEQGAFRLNIVRQDLIPIIKQIVTGSSGQDNFLIQLPAEYFVETDADIFSIIVKNLIDNAIKYSDAKAAIKVSLENDVLTISNGPGHAGYPDPDKIFTKYYRAEKSHRGRGTGLGLWLCKELSDRIGARIAYEPDNEKIHFKLYLSK